MNWRERIVVDPAICHGQACIKGMRVRVSVILDNLAAGRTADQVVEDYSSLDLADVHAAIAYAAELARESVVDFPPAVHG